MPLIVEFVTANCQGNDQASGARPEPDLKGAETEAQVKSEERSQPMQERDPKVYAKEDVRQGTVVKPMRLVLGASILLAVASLVTVAISVSGA